MENGTIKDAQINATSVYMSNFATYARLNSRNGWCAGKLDDKQFIQVWSIY